MGRILTFSEHKLTEKRSQLIIPFDGKHPLHGKEPHEHIIDAFEDLQVMKPDEYYSVANVGDLIQKHNKAAFESFMKSMDESDEREYFMMFTEDPWNCPWTEEGEGHYSKEMWQCEEFVSAVESKSHWRFTEAVVGDGGSSSDCQLDLETEVFSKEGKATWIEFLEGAMDGFVNEMEYGLDEDEDGLIKVYRAVVYNNSSDRFKTKPDGSQYLPKHRDIYNAIMKTYKGTGTYWTWDSSRPEAYSAPSSGSYFVLHGRIRPEDVDWEETIYKSMYHLKEEREIKTLDKKGTCVKLTGMENDKGQFIEFETEYVVPV